MESVSRIAIGCKAEPEIIPYGNQELAGQLEADLILNPWAWCSITVVARWGRYTGREIAGMCSYSSEGEFRSSERFQEMVCDAMDHLRREIAKGMTWQLKVALNQALGAATSSGQATKVVVDFDSELAPYGVEMSYEPADKPIVCTCLPCGGIE